MSEHTDSGFDDLPEPPDEAWRRAAIADADHSISLSGGSIPADTAAVFERWATRELTWAEVRVEIDRLYPASAHGGAADASESGLTAAEEAYYADLAERIERDDYESAPEQLGEGRVLTGRAAAEFGRRLLDQPPAPEQVLALLRQGAIPR